jgi:hypothetical protein
MVTGDSLPLSACGILLANALTLGRGGDERTVTIGAMLSYLAVMVSFYCTLLLHEPELIHAQESFLPALCHYGPQVGVATSDEWGVTGFAALIASVVVYAAWSARGSWTDEVRPFYSLMLSLALIFLSQKNVASVQPSALWSKVGASPPCSCCCSRQRSRGRLAPASWTRWVRSRRGRASTKRYVSLFSFLWSPSRSAFGPSPWRRPRAGC